MSMIGKIGQRDSQAVTYNGELQLLQNTNIINSKLIVDGSYDPDRGRLTLRYKDGTSIYVEGFLTNSDYDNGTIGLQGISGVDGLDGSDGIDGKIGQPGCSGDQGPQGIQGDKGPTGNQGPQGPQGIAGVDGPIGQQGPQGPQGYSGYRGPVGPVGNQGPQGPTGDTGLSIIGVNCCNNTLTLLLSDGTEKSVRLPDAPLAPQHMSYAHTFSDNLKGVKTYGYIIDPASGFNIINILQKRLLDDLGIIFYYDWIALVYTQYFVDVQLGGAGRPPDYDGLRDWLQKLHNYTLQPYEFIDAFSKSSDIQYAKNYNSALHYYRLLPITEALTAQGSNLIPTLSASDAAGKQSWVVPGTFTFTVPANVKSINVTMYAGGGGSGACNSKTSVGCVGGGGGAGEKIVSTLTVVPFETLNIQIGDGGAGASFAFDGTTMVNYKNPNFGSGTPGQSTFIERDLTTLLIARPGQPGSDTNQGIGYASGLQPSGANNPAAGLGYNGPILGGTNDSGQPPSNTNRGTGYGNGGGQSFMGVGVDGQSGAMLLTWDANINVTSAPVQ